MGYFSTQEKVIAICKEGTRGTQSVTAPSYIPVTADSNIDYKPNLVENDKMRGILEPFQPILVTKDCTGIINMDAEPELIGEFLNSLMGKDTISGAGIPYTHTLIKKPISVADYMLHQSYTIHIGRGDDTSIFNYAYLRQVVKSIVFTGNGADILKLGINLIGEKEENSTLVTAGNRFSPTWAAPIPFIFNEGTTFTLGAVNAAADIKDWTLTIDNGAIGKRTHGSSQDIADVICPGALLVSGGFTMYFQTEVERAKFLANTASLLTIVYTRGATTTLRSLTITLPQIHYTAFPYGDADGILAAAVTFNCYYKISGAATAATFELKNAVTTGY